MHIGEAISKLMAKQKTSVEYNAGPHSALKKQGSPDVEPSKHPEKIFSKSVMWIWCVQIEDRYDYCAVDTS